MQSPRNAEPSGLSPAMSLGRSSSDLALGRMPLIDRATLVAAGISVVVYVIYFAQLKSLPLQDYPNHLARAAVIADLLFEGGARHGGAFDIALGPMPYVLHDLLFASLLQVFGTAVGTGIFTAIVLLSLPCALLFYMRVTGVAPRATLTVLLLSLYLATDWFFLMAFTAFRLAVAGVIVALAVAELLRRQWSAFRYAAYLGVLLLGYFTHLSAIVFFLPVIAVSALCRLIARTSTPMREIQLVLPVLAILGFHFLVVEEPRTDEYPAVFQFYWGTWNEKWMGLWYEFGRFGGRSSKLLLVLAVSCVLLAVWRQLRPSRLLSPMVMENALIAVAFAGIYMLLPREYADSTYVDVRAQAMVSLFVVVTSLWLVQPVQGRGYDGVIVRGLVMLLVALNLAHIARKVTPVDDWLSRYRKVVAAVPEGARVLPISTRGKVGNFSPSLHAGSFLILDRAALEPYLFSRDRGDVMKFFRYRDRPYMPQENWYREQLKWRAGVPETYTVLGKDYTWRFRYFPNEKIWKPLTLVPIEWNRVACDYDWLLVTRPYDAEVIEIPASVKAQNETASLLAVDKRACRPDRVRRLVRLPTEH